MPPHPKRYGRKLQSGLQHARLMILESIIHDYLSSKSLTIHAMSIQPEPSRLVLSRYTPTLRGDPRRCGHSKVGIDCCVTIMKRSKRLNSRRNLLLLIQSSSLSIVVQLELVKRNHLHVPSGSGSEIQDPTLIDSLALVGLWCPQGVRVEVDLREYSYEYLIPANN